MGQLDGQQAPRMVPDQPRQRLLQERDLAPQPPFGQLRHGGGVRPALDQGRQDRPARHPHHVRGHRRQLDLARSNTPCTRLTSRLRSCTNLVR